LLPHDLLVLKPGRSRHFVYQRHVLKGVRRIDPLDRFGRHVSTLLLLNLKHLFSVLSYWQNNFFNTANAIMPNFKNTGQGKKV